MIAHPPFGSSSFKLVAKGLVALHRLGKNGKDDSPEAESVRDALDAPLKALNRIEKERAQWLSEDLYSVSEPPATSTQKDMNPQAQQQLYEVFEAQQSRDWDRALVLLRRWREYITPALLSYLRGSIWQETGNSELATVFFGHASESDPANVHYRSTYIYNLAKSNPDIAGKLAQDVLADDAKFAPLVVAQAAKIRCSENSDAETDQRYRKLIPILERNLVRLEKDETAVSREVAYSITVDLLGICHEHSGNFGSAINYFTQGLQMNPNNEGLLVARGILLYGTSPRAIPDLEQAVGLGSTVVWPYLYLAHHYLITSRFEQCRVMCELGLQMSGSHTAKSQLEEWRAIAQAEIGFPPELVRAAFEAAVRLDPSNEMAQRNRAVFEGSLRVLQTPTRSKWEQKSEAVVRQFGLAERRYTSAA